MNSEEKNLELENEDLQSEEDLNEEIEENINGEDEASEEVEHDDEEGLLITSEPFKTSYVGGEEIEYNGISVEFNGEDVTDEVEFIPSEGSVWRKTDETKDVNVVYNDGGVKYTAKFTISKKKERKTLVIVIVTVVVVALAVGGFFAYNHFSQTNRSTEKLGSYVLPKGDMSDEEAQAMLDEQAEKSRITVSVNPEMELTDDHKVRINFIVVEPNNGYSERMELEQDGNIVYSSEIVPPGYKIEWAQANSTIKTGPAVVTVYGIGESGDDTGNPISVEVEIVENGNGES